MNALVNNCNGVLEIFLNVVVNVLFDTFLEAVQTSTSLYIRKMTLMSCGRVCL